VIAPHRTVARLAALLVAKRLLVWGSGLLILSWFVYLHTMLVPGITDRVGRLKGADYIQFYVMGSMAVDGRWDALYDPDAHLAEGRRRIQSDLRLYAPHPNYGPQVALMFEPLAVLSWRWSLAIYLGLSCACYVLSVWLIWRECPSLRLRGPLVCVLAAGSPLFFSWLRYGQTSAFALLLWALALAALTRDRQFVAGLIIGGLAYKPQFTIVLGVVILAARQWRVAAGAVTTGVGQLVVGAIAAGTDNVRRYLEQLWILSLNPQWVEIHPSEAHSLSGLFRLLITSPMLIRLCTLAGLAACLTLAIRAWLGPAPLRLRWALLIPLTVLASPHLLTYDLLLLTLPLLVFADWVAEHPNHPLSAGVSVLLVLVYFSPFSAQIARVTRVQISVLVLLGLAWRFQTICAARSLGYVRTADAGA
jgi:alpha-1,2-mannosyltransferase